MPDLFTVSPTSGTGSVFLTEFTFVVSNPEATAYAWDFGDKNNSYSGPSVSHIYNFPGTYTVSGSAWSDTGSLSSYKLDVTVDYVLPNKLEFTQIPDEFSDPGEKTSSPFVVSLTCTEIQDNLYLDLQSLNTNSIPFEDVPTKWQSITPKWKFIDASTNKVVQDGLLVKTSPIYRSHNGQQRIVAVSGEASFYYIDDLSTNFTADNTSPVLLIATLSTSNFVYHPDSPVYPYNSDSNNDAAKAAVIWQINNYFPTNLKVTENFISNVYPYKWTNVPIPTMVSCQFDSRLNKNFTGSPLITANILEYPRTNNIGSSFPVNIILSNNQSFTVENSSAVYFQSTDEQNNISSGYVYTSITPTASSSSLLTVNAYTSCVEPLAVSADINSFAFPYGYPIYSNAYVYQPYSSKINNILLTNCPYVNSYIKYYKDLGVLSDGKTKVWNLPVLSSFETLTPQSSSSAPLYGIAFNPILNVIHTCDPLSGHINTLNSKGEVEDISIDLTTLLGQGEFASPCCMSIDQNHNIWVSLRNEETLIKLDKNLDTVRVAEPSTYVEENPLVVPPMVETDRNGNVWASFAELSAAHLVLFDSGGRELINISEPLSSSVPVSLAVDAKNSVWVACYNTNMVMNISSDGTILNNLSGGFTRPNHLAVDRSSSIWYTHGYNFISTFNQNTRVRSTWQFSTPDKTSARASESNPTYEIPLENEMWGGLAVDVHDRVWALDSKTNTAIVFNATNPLSPRFINLLPSLSTVSIVLSAPSSGLDIPTSHIHSTQAVGDWTGNKWYQKYAEPISFAAISGTSTPFTVSDLKNSYNLAKVNEEFDVSAYFKSLALPESLSRNELFFDEFLAAVVGDGNPTKESAGRVIYERIANFVQTHGDFETSEIDQLMSYAKQLSVDAKTFGTNFPNEIIRLINLFSIPKNKLRGRISYEADPTNNVGPLLTQTDIISAGQYLFARDKYSSNYQLVYVTPGPGDVKTYPLSQLTVGGFVAPLNNNYYFFEYTPTQLGYVDNIINWDSDYTTFDYTLSSNEEWYGDNGLVEMMFNRILTERLLS